MGISLVGGFVGGAVARGTAGMMMGTGGAAVMENLTLGGAIVARGAGLAAETAIQSAGQSVIFDDKLGTAFLENLIMNLGSAAVLKALGSKVEEAARLEKATQGFWQRGAAASKVVIKETAAITGHAVMGAAMGYVAHKIVTGKEQPSPATLEEWLMQGAGIAVGRYVGRAIEASHARQKRLELRGHEASMKLAADTEKLAALAKRVEANPQPKDAMELLAKRHELLTEELKLLDDIGVGLDAYGLPKGGPHFTIDKRVGQDGSEYRIDIEGIASLTDFALAEGSRRYEKRFGHPPTDLPGSLGDDNKAIFQRAYVTAINKGVDPRTAEKLAATETPFVRARVRRGYKAIDVTVLSTEVLVIGIPPRKLTVPTTIHVTAKKDK